MQGVSQGATEAGGKAIGITCALFDGQRPGANPFLSEAIHTPDLFARLRQLTGRGDGFVVLGGGVGTMLELLLVWNLLAIGAVDRPCVLVGRHWRRVLTDLERETQIGAGHSALLQVVDTVEEAVRLLKRTLDG
jgi:predicted Rossmann-fold nucleotide-binding protein